MLTELLHALCKRFFILRKANPTTLLWSLITKGRKTEYGNRCNNIFLKNFTLDRNSAIWDRSHQKPMFSYPRKPGWKKRLSSSDSESYMWWRAYMSLICITLTMYVADICLNWFFQLPHLLKLSNCNRKLYYVYFKVLILTDFSFFRIE